MVLENWAGANDKHTDDLLLPLKNLLISGISPTNLIDKKPPTIEPLCADAL
jgi:hypothetical protein